MAETCLLPFNDPENARRRLQWLINLGYQMTISARGQLSYRGKQNRTPCSIQRVATPTLQPNAALPNERRVVQGRGTVGEPIRLRLPVFSGSLRHAAHSGIPSSSFHETEADT
jgi:hypothetical protein